MVSKKARLSETESLLNSGMKKKVSGTSYLTTIRSGKKRKKVWKNVGKTRNDK